MRPNTRQRSWSNYEGDNPIKRYEGSSFYRDSLVHGPADSEEEDPLKKKKQRRDNRLRDSMLQMGISDPNNATP
jgi:hypothetical protein